jgi:hypothetical protein
VVDALEPPAVQEVSGGDCNCEAQNVGMGIAEQLMNALDSDGDSMLSLAELSVLDTLIEGTDSGNDSVDSAAAETDNATEVGNLDDVDIPDDVELNQEGDTSAESYVDETVDDIAIDSGTEEIDVDSASEGDLPPEEVMGEEVLEDADAECDKVTEVDETEISAEAVDETSGEEVEVDLTDELVNSEDNGHQDEDSNADDESSVVAESDSNDIESGIGGDEVEVGLCSVDEGTTTEDVVDQEEETGNDIVVEGASEIDVNGDSVVDSTDQDVSAEISGEDLDAESNGEEDTGLGDDEYEMPEITVADEITVESDEDSEGGPVAIDTDPTVVGANEGSEDDEDQELLASGESGGEKSSADHCGEEGINSEDAAEKLLTTFDTDGDESLSKDELTAMLDKFWADVELSIGI